MTSTLTSKGQITIPQAVRDALGLKPGHKLDFHVLPDGRIEVEVLRQASLEELKSLLPKAKKHLSLEDMDAVIAEASGHARS
jgi:AbrB family looped-hinge helix DNA binding protein